MRPKANATNNNIQNVTSRRSVAEVDVVTDIINTAINNLHTQLVVSNIKSQIKVIVNFINIQTSNIAYCVGDVVEMRGGKFDGFIRKKINNVQLKSIASTYSSTLAYVDNFETAG